ncbi:hypothetical protein BBJ28_00003974 [Nothophytophthora sp. Chile5]|nr:hypothetical protein BBJ28_00003974 [Nothophytophthora sp. Chile5]
MFVLRFLRLQKLFRDLVDSLFVSIQEENNRLSSELCQSLLATLHAAMTEKIDAHMLLGPQDDQDSYSFQSTEFKKEELAKFTHNVIRPQLAEFSEKLEKIRQHDVDVIDESIEKSEDACEAFNAKQKHYQRETMDAQTDVQLPEQKVIEAAQDKETTELQGYLIKQGGGGNVLNPLGRKNWKQRYFILIGVNLIYARTKDDYERGKIIKELCLTGCRIDPSRDAGEGFNIIPGKAAHVFELQRGLFEKNSKKRSSTADSGRTFKLRAQSIEERDVQSLLLDLLDGHAGLGIHLNLQFFQEMSDL